MSKHYNHDEDGEAHGTIHSSGHLAPLNPKNQARSHIHVIKERCSQCGHHKKFKNTSQNGHWHKKCTKCKTKEEI